MAAYVIIEVQVVDAEVYKQYVEQVREVVENHGGRYRVRGGTVTPMSGDWRPERMIVIEFASVDQVQACFRSEAYGKVAPLRTQSTISRAIVVEGCTEERQG